MDPLEEIQAIKEEMGREFPTVQALCDYLRKNYPVTRPASPSVPQSVRRRGAVKAKARANASADARPAMRQRKVTAQA